MMDQRIRRKRTSNNAKNEELVSVPLKLPKTDAKLDKLPKSKLVEMCEFLQKELKYLKENSDKTISSLKEQIVNLQVKQKEEENMLSVQTQTYPQNDIDLNCGVCVAQYSSEEDLWVHMDIDHDVQKQDASQKFKCKNCEYTFGNSNDLKYHMKEKHEGCVEPCKFFARGVCYFTEETCWYSHMVNSNINNPNVNLKCKYCGEQFTHKHELMSHRRLHHEEKIAACKEYETGKCKYGNICWFKHRENDENINTDASKKLDNFQMIGFLEERILTMENQIRMKIN